MGMLASLEDMSTGGILAPAGDLARCGLFEAEFGLKRDLTKAVILKERQDYRSVLRARQTTHFDGSTLLDEALARTQ